MTQTISPQTSIGVLMGGYSSEREISLKSGKAVCQALQEAGCRVTPLDIEFKEADRIEQFIRTAAIDVAFIALHGELGEDGRIQSILEKIGIPYPGSGPEASRLAINKVTTQKILKSKGIPISEFVIIVDDGQPARLHAEKCLQELKLPVVVKPACEGSSIGITMAAEKDNLTVAIAEAFRYGKEVLVERYVPGREMTVGILAEQCLPVVEIRPKVKFFDFSAKYEGGTEYLVPAPLTVEQAAAVQSAALAAYRALGCRDFSRVDVILGEDGRPYVLEVNTIPGFTATSLLPKAAKAVGMDFTQLCMRLIELAYGKKR